MSRIRASLTYANVAATLALFLALTGGVVYAAEKIGSNDIAANAIESRHVRANALGSRDINEGTLRGVPVSGYERVTKDWEVQPDSRLFLTARCPRGKVAMSGGYFSDIPVEQFVSLVSDDNVYTSGIRNANKTRAAEVEISAVCVKG